MTRPIDAQGTVEELRRISQKRLDRVSVFVGTNLEACVDSYVMGVNDAIRCIDAAETLPSEIACRTCECWHRRQNTDKRGYCMAVYEDEFPFHCDQPPTTEESFVCGYARKKEDKTSD